MSRRIRILMTAFIAALVTALPARASAELFATPFGGVTFLDNNHRKGTFGASVGGGGVVSFEFEAARTLLGSYEEIPVVDLNARVSTFMGNVMVRMPTGVFQPYATAGAGIVRLTGSVDVPFLGQVVGASADDFGVNVGGGLMIFPTPNIGFRADVRWFQTGELAWDDIAGIGGIDDIPLPKVNFWRTTGGITFKF